MYGCFGWFAFRTPEFPAPFALDFFGASHLLVDGDGHRFADETGYEVHDPAAGPAQLPASQSQPAAAARLGGLRRGGAARGAAERPARNAERVCLEPR